MNRFLDWFNGQETQVKVALLIVAGIVGLGFLWSFVFYGADFSGFGEWVKSVLG